jgi:hypothetical protein
MATHARGAANLAAFHPVQLTLQLCSQRSGSQGVARPRLFNWARVDLADVGGELQARTHAVTRKAPGVARRRQQLDRLLRRALPSPVPVSAVPPRRCPPAWMRSARPLTPSPATTGGCLTPRRVAREPTSSPPTR